MQGAESELDDIKARRGACFRFFRLWQRLGWTLSIIVAAGSAYVASGLSAGPMQARDLVALIVAVCAGVQAVLQPMKRSLAYREAWIELDLALKKHEKIPQSLLDAIRRGENKIGDSHAERRDDRDARDQGLRGKDGVTSGHDTSSEQGSKE